jgi:hypothetical protein
MIWARFQTVTKMLEFLDNMSTRTCNVFLFAVYSYLPSIQVVQNSDRKKCSDGLQRYDAKNHFYTITSLVV